MSPTSPRIQRQGPLQPKKGPAALIVLIVLAICAVGVVLVLPIVVNKSSNVALISPVKNSDVLPPDLTSDQTRPPSPLVRSDDTTAKQKAIAQIEPDRRIAAELLGRALRKQARLENEGAKIWGKTRLKTSYPEVKAILAKANQEFDKRNFVIAINGLQEANILLDRLMASKVERLRRALEAARTLLSKNDSVGAIDQYRFVLALEPGDDRATAGLERAKNRPRVLVTIEDGELYEKSGRLNDALLAYVETIRLDPAFAPAQRSAERVRALIKERDFKGAISKALSSLDKKDFLGAERALEAADRLRPNTSNVSEIRGQVHIARQFATLNLLRKKAVTYERKEQWKDAIEVYEKALRIDQTAGFAVKGRSRAGKYFRLHEQIALYLNNPHRLYSPGPLIHARRVLDAADAITDAGPGLTANRDSLRKEITRADIPHSVLLLSDEFTKVAVYRVGQFGAFRQKRLALRPGTYTAVGSRTGYRDVRVRFRVDPAKLELKVVVKCNERI